MLFVVCPFSFGHWSMHRISIYGISIPFGILIFLLLEVVIWKQIGPCLLSPNLLVAIKTSVHEPI
jgi:hypothetical protein